ncbi:MAG: hypothetical protein KME11_00130 [Timaviella obliquedivisa GSE-PSE-MK23-08B]|nr:hypothetical protein [Timaviella obliquedivisa GSE-PSE-MK23-08B]
MKYFFLSEGWNVGRVWEFGGLWNEASWRRKPEIDRLNLHISENNEKLWLYQVEEEVIMLEVKPATESATNSTIGQVVLKRLITAEQVIERICSDYTL